MKQKSKIIVEITLIFIAPVLIFLFELIPYGYRLLTLEVFAGLVIIYAILNKLSWHKMGFRFDTFLGAAKLLLPGTIIAIIAIIILFLKGIGTTYIFENWERNYFFLYYLILGAATQEFGYRGYLLVKLKKLTNNAFVIILLNSILFAWLHILHKDIFILVGTFIFGTYLTWVYLKKPNILASSIAHGVVGAMAIILGFF